MDTRRLTDFQIPLTFPSVAFLRNEPSDNYESGSVLEASLAKSKPTVLEYCGLPNSQSPPENEKDGLVLGCQDGTVYVLHRLPPLVPTIGPQALQIDEPLRLKNLSRLSKSSHPNSHSMSPTAPSLTHSPAFNVTAKPRVVSGVTAEQVEAPKNYVDFEDEPDKLKDILKGKNPRERHSVSETSSDRTPKSAASSVIEPVPISKRKSGPPRSLLSATNSRAPTPPSFSAPASPREQDCISPPELVSSWTLRYHIIPSRSGSGYAVKSIQFLNEDRFFAILQATGDLYVFSSDDGACVASFRVGEEPYQHFPTGIKERQKRDIWMWSNLAVSYIEESVILVVTAANDSDECALTADTDEGTSHTSRCVLLDFVTTPSEVQLHKLGQWDLDGPAKGDGIYREPDGTFTFFSTSHDGHFIVRKFTLRAPLPSPPKVSSASHPDSEGNHHHGPHLSTLPIPNPFKAIMSRSTEHLPLNDSEVRSLTRSDSKPSLSEPRDIGMLIPDTALSGLKTRHLSNGKLSGIAWTHREISLFEYSQQSMTLLFQGEVTGIQDAIWSEDEMYALSFEDRVEVYQIKVVNADNEEVDNIRPTSPSSLHTQPELIRTLYIGEHDALEFTHGSLITTASSQDQRAQTIFSYTISETKDSQSPQDLPRVLWRTAEAMPSLPKITLTSTLPLELELIVQGYSDGILRRFSLAQMARKSDQPISTSSSIKTSNPPLSGHVVGLHVVQNPRTRERYIVGGADDGSIGFWSLNTFELVARWSIFVTPLAKVVQFEAETTGPLRGCALCISRDGTIAVIVIDGFHFRYLVPGSAAPLKRICLGGNNLLAIYGDHQARLWDAQTKELWRSFEEDKAEELLAQGGWTQLTLGSDACLPKTLWTSVADSFDGQDAAASLLLNLERVIVDSISVTKTISTSRDEVREILLALDRLRLILSALLTPGLNEGVDSICYGKLGAYPSSAIVGLWSGESTTLFQSIQPQDVWCLSPNITASRALAVIAVLREMSLFEELTEGANTVISFYTQSLAACVGPQFKAPSLHFLGRLWFEASNELRQPIRTLFDATIANMPDEESIMVAEKWQHHVPSLQPDAEKETMNAALALFICGCIASEKYSLLSTSALTDISKSISLYLNDEKSIYRILAIDLCSRGFNVWQHYIDAMEILRSLFDLATNVRKDSISVQNISAQARLAVLLIASNNMPLFMGTLCLDILSPPSTEHQRSVLQILAFLIRKRPHILQPSLPRLMEAVVKSLDPNATSNREQVLDTATEIIGYVVKTFPTVDFHMATQRLAVGTNEGAVVMYDLKTAIRLYVLESHKKPITACSFCADGRRLVTISLKESTVLVWKVGSSFASFFNPGAPPRQGHGGSQPFKTLSFNIGSEADMTTAETLDLVSVEWIADRSVRVKIRQSILTFST
ncbi:hypothetical protein GALMADRAFT_237950 [Galerina marginata CBS 339.88]|uniref:Uncharacterized protein n=1 Tax=Galerina marginata (strain CBS 339.88) TaxID=685588 RepID=A0A067TRN4_GALM3|nr:hypothetical protein GALMADRAFT_237950 [Galerina marginata CBS 339.88]